MAYIDASSSLCPGYVVVALHGELDVTDAARVTRALSAAAAPASEIIVDLAGLAFMDCSSLSALRKVQQQARRAGGDLVLAAPQQPVARLLSLTDPAGLLPVFASVEEAANGIGAPPALVCRAAEQAGGKANSADGAAAPTGPRYFAPVGMPGASV